MLTTHCWTCQPTVYLVAFLRCRYTRALHSTIPILVAFCALIFLAVPSVLLLPILATAEHWYFHRTFFLRIHNWRNRREGLKPAVWDEPLRLPFPQGKSFTLLMHYLLLVTQLSIMIASAALEVKVSLQFYNQVIPFHQQAFSHHFLPFLGSPMITLKQSSLIKVPGKHYNWQHSLNLKFIKNT